MKREVPVEQAVGMTLAHDLTRIVPGEFKGRVFAKGHVIREEDISTLLDIGKRFIYVLELEPGEMHENEAAVAMAQALGGDGIAYTEVHEGKVVLKAARDGMLWIDENRVLQMNQIEGISVTTRSPWMHVQIGTSVAGVRPIPLVIEREKVMDVVRIAQETDTDRRAIAVLPYQLRKAALVTTGSEIQSGRIEDKFGPTLREKLSLYGVEVVMQEFPGDEFPDIVAAIEAACSTGAEMVCVTGGMSVDPDDRSPAAIRHIATEVVTYGTPMLPGSMLMLAYRGTVPIFGLPGAVIYDSRTSFDVLLPRVLAGWKVSRLDIARLGVGGWLNA
jgi:Probable molybdopterin binding domain